MIIELLVKIMFSDYVYYNFPIAFDATVEFLANNATITQVLRT